MVIHRFVSPARLVSYRGAHLDTWFIAAAAINGNTTATAVQADAAASGPGGVRTTHAACVEEPRSGGRSPHRWAYQVTGGSSGSSSFLLSQRMPPPFHCRNLHRATTTTTGSFPSRGGMCCFPCWLPTTSSTASGRCRACRSLASRGAGASGSRGLGYAEMKWGEKREVHGLIEARAFEVVDE